MFKCEVCGAELPDGVQECPNCKVWQEPPAKFNAGQLVKLVVKENGYVYYNYVIDSYYNRTINMRMYRLRERIALAVWREDWLEPVSEEEVERVNATGLLRLGKMGGYEHPITEGCV